MKDSFFRRNVKLIRAGRRGAKRSTCRRYNYIISVDVLAIMTFKKKVWNLRDNPEKNG